MYGKSVLFYLLRQGFSVYSRLAVPAASRQVSCLPLTSLQECWDNRRLPKWSVLWFELEFLQNHDERNPQCTALRGGMIYTVYGLLPLFKSLGELARCFCHSVPSVIGNIKQHQYISSRGESLSHCIPNVPGPSEFQYPGL